MVAERAGRSLHLNSGESRWFWTMDSIVLEREVDRINQELIERLGFWKIRVQDCGSIDPPGISIF